jgi:hypothetical protein
MSNENLNIDPKNTFAIARRVRRRSSNTSSSDTSIQDYKRGRLDISQVSTEMETSQEKIGSREDIDEFTMKIMEALIKPNVLIALASSLKQSCIEAAQEATKELGEDVKNLKIADQNKEERITHLETAMDSQEQEKRKCGVVIQGLPEVENENTKKEIIEFAKRSLKIEIGDEDVVTAFRVGQKTENDGKNKDRPIKVTFKKYETKCHIMKIKSSLKDQELRVWINEDLTPRMNHLAYCARRAVKEGKAAMSWIVEAKVFIKVGQDGKPQRITTEDDLKKLKIINL